MNISFVTDHDCRNRREEILFSFGQAVAEKLESPHVDSYDVLLAPRSGGHVPAFVLHLLKCHEN
jgi:hypothetical protein